MSAISMRCEYQFKKDVPCPNPGKIEFTCVKCDKVFRFCGTKHLMQAPEHVCGSDNVAPTAATTAAAAIVLQPSALLVDSVPPPKEVSNTIKCSLPNCDMRIAADKVNTWVQCSLCEKHESIHITNRAYYCSNEHYTSDFSRHMNSCEGYVESFPNSK